MTTEADQALKFRAGYAAIIGAPNVGKSTLMNRLVGQKISIVTSKPQTTRHKVLGILSRPEYQIVFLDTPGLLEPQYLLQKTMLSAAHSAVYDADIVLYMLDASEPECATTLDGTGSLKLLQESRKPVYLLLNKSDKIDKSSLLPMIAVCAGRFPFTEIFPISARNGDGTEDLLGTIARSLPEHPPFYPPDIVSEHPERFFVCEIIREKIFETFREEIPYSTTVDIVEFREQPGKKDLINAEIYVERDSQKGILIGKGGRALKEIGEAARKDIEEFLERPVFLQLYVKVREKWRDKPEWLRRLGYMK